MATDARSSQTWVAVVVFVLGAFLHLPAGYFLRYARVDLLPSPGLFLAGVPLAIAAALVHEALVRGKLYAALQLALPAGLAAPSAALAGAVVPLAARLYLFPVPNVPFPAVAGHVLMVEFVLSLGLTWIALGTGSTRPGTAALAALWILRMAFGVRFHGGALPLLELAAAVAATLLVAKVLAEPLAPHRERLLGAA